MSDTSTRPIRILHVDDDPGALAATENYFERFHESIVVETTTDPGGIVDHVRDSDIECLLCDFEMPEEDGLSVLESVREAGLSQPFILYTGKGSEDVASEAISAGVTDYVEKGDGMDHFAVLANRIENAVARYRNEQRRAAADATPPGSEETDHERALARYETIVETIDDAAVVVDRDWEIAYANEYALDRAGMDLDAVRGTPTMEIVSDLFVDPAKVDRYESLLERVFEQGADLAEPPSLEVTVDLPAGGVIREYRLSPVVVDGTVEAVVLLARDVTERRERERELERVREKQEQTLERISDGFFAVDTDREITYVNEAGADVLRQAMGADYDVDELLGKELWAEVPEAVDTPFYEHFERAMETQESVSFEEYYEPLDTWFEVRAYPDADGISVYFRDITDRKERERNLETYERALNAAVDMVYQLDADGNFVMVNDAWVERTGYDRADLIGEHVSLVMTDDALDRGRRYITEALRRGDDQTETLEFEVQAAGGETFPAESRIAIRREDGAFAGTVGVTRDITARRERERELERFEEVVNVVDDGVYALDDDGQFELVNDAMTELTGYDRAELLGEHTRIIKDEATVEKAEDALRSLLSGEAAETTFELPVQLKNDTEVACEDHMTVRYGEDGAFAGTAGVIRDVTDQKERQEKLESLVETTQALMTVRDEDAVVETAIEAASEALGFEMATLRLYDEATGTLEPVAQVSPPGEEKHQRPAYDIGEFPTGEVFQTGEPLVRDDLTDDPDSGAADAGLYVPVGERGTLSMGSSAPGAFDELDRQVATVLSTSTATALHRVQREQALRRERNRIAALFETIPESIAHVRFDSGRPIVQTVNQAFEDVFGHAEHEVVGEDLNEFIVPEHERQRGRQIDERAVAEEPVEREVRRLAADGERDFLFRSVPLAGQDRQDAVESIGVYVDITDQKETERELKRQNERLDRFASTVSHDLRNPLKIAMSHLDMATHECETDLLDDVAAAHDRMAELIEDLLAMARQGQAVEDPDDLSLAAVAREAWENVDTGVATFEGIVADGETADSPTVAADRGRLLQAFENLFRNSVEHGSTARQNPLDSGDSVEHGSTGNRTESGDSVEHGSEDVTVKVESTDEGFAVVDDGPGIPADEREAVFEYGYTTADTGTGFGLAIVKEVADAHGWTVTLADPDEDAGGDGDGDAGTGFDAGARFEFRT